MRQVCLAIAAFLLLAGVARGFAQEVEGVKVVRKITFKGNTAIDEKTLRASIASRQAPLLYRLALTRWIGLAHAPAFDPHELRRDVLRVQALYGVHGFSGANVDNTLVLRGIYLELI